MEFNESNEKLKADFNIDALLNIYSSQWKWFLLSLLFCFSIVFSYLRYFTVPSFQASTTLILKDDKGSINPELKILDDFGGKSNLNTNVDNEIEIMKSRTLIEETIKNLNLNVILLARGRILDKDLYGKAPIKVEFTNTNNQFYNTKFEIDFVGNTSNTFILEMNDENPNFFLNRKKIFRYGELIKTKYGNLTISKNYNSKINYRNLSILVIPFDEAVASYQNKIKIAPVPSASGIVEISIADPIVLKSIDFLTAFVNNYNQAAIANKNSVFEKTSRFISERLKVVTQELDGVEGDVASFKRSNNLLNVESESSNLFEESKGYDQKLEDFDLQSNSISSILNIAKKSNYTDLLPNTIIIRQGQGQGDILGFINSYNQLVLDRNKILKSATSENPNVIKIEQQLISLKNNIISVLTSFQAITKNQKADLIKSKSILNAKILNLPKMELQFKVISRQQKVKEGLYLFLLQRREESALYLSTTISDARVVDSPKTLPIPVSPNKSTLYLVALLIGLLFPLSIFYLIDFMNNKIKSRYDLQGETTIPFIGDLPKSDTPNEIMKPENRTSSAEALRIISTNLEFMLTEVPEGEAKTIFLTSTFPKEGKTFVSVNLAATFALTGKKVLLMSMDIRNPKLSEYIVLPDDRGVTNYLSSKDSKIEDMILKQEGFKNFDVLPPGVIPPNPAELLMGTRVDDLFKYLKLQYDYIIVDTSPVNLVTDTLLLAKHSDCFVYIVRANFLEKKMLQIINLLYKENKLKNMCMLLNDTNFSKLGYGYTYGYTYGYSYGYGVEPENPDILPWYKKLFKI